jgi:hypothetical protein
MVELNIAASFKNPWNADEEVKVLSESKKKDAKRRWHAGTDSNRINVISHGSFGLIAFSGTIDKDNGAVGLDTRGALDLSIRETEPIPIKGGKEVQETLGAIARRLQNRFTKDPKAKIVFYMCNSGTDLELMQEIANAFQVQVDGFSHNVHECLDWELNSAGRVQNINRTLTSNGLKDNGECTDPKPGFKHLTPDRFRVPK